MSRLSSLAVALSAALALLSALPASAETEDRSLVPVGSLTEVANFAGPGPSGIVVTKEGRTFVGFPRHAIDHKGMTLGELVNGKLVPYPDAATSLPGRDDAHRLVSVHGMTQDSKGRLWLIDDGKRAGIDGIPAGAAKVVGIDPKTNRIFASVLLDAGLKQDSHMNDLRIDLTHGDKGTAYVADSSFGDSPAIVVVDIASGRQRRVLGNDPSVRPQKDFVTQLDGVPMRYDGANTPFPHGGVDSVALAPDSSRFYYSPLTSRHLWSLPTAALSNFSLSDAQLAAQIRDEGEKVMTDGMDMDSQGRLYLTDAEHHQILRRWPDGHLDVVLRDPRLVWPDGLFVTGDSVYVTLGQWDRLGKHSDTRKPPYLLIRTSTEPTPQFNAQ
ncbi:MAG: L-dopachrome tautomerase-related protein [Pseudomonas sp.]|uniref:SMP-30/gluconolactonase/LRE family protein n=1 Tax=Pseudomonas abieticivorans TaxID=2931382 RepID=UPI0020BD718B|nr:major royal jelly family protein [Pseudomonas sp. PIA16]MDE1168904.1 L-dopachrome tautomerase-related protein [Pseudomonas sp.]